MFSPSLERLVGRLSCDCTIEECFEQFTDDRQRMLHIIIIFFSGDKKKAEKSPHEMRLNLFAFATLNSKHVGLLDEQIDLFFHIQHQIGG